MSYLNRFLIEEDTQFECAGVVPALLENIVGQTTVAEREDYEKSIENFGKSLEQTLLASNSDSFIGHLIISNGFKYSSSFLARVSNFPFMITRIGSERLRCVQKEDYESLHKLSTTRLVPYKGGILENVSTGLDPYVLLSVGDDIDDFYDRIKMNNIDTVRACAQWYSNLIESDAVKTIHIPMLSDEEERNMNSENRRLVNFKYETKLSKTQQNYAFSWCVRKTVYWERPSCFGCY